MTLVRGRETEQDGTAGGDPAAAEPRVAHEADFHAWSVQQARWLLAGRLDLLDLENLSDEIASLGRNDVRTLRSSIRLILHHLLKWDHQPERRSRSWALTAMTHRNDVADLLADGPSLRRPLPEVVAKAYINARLGALAETNLPDDALPLACPYSWDDIMTRPIAWTEQP